MNWRQLLAILQRTLLRHKSRISLWELCAAMELLSNCKTYEAYLAVRLGEK